MLSTTLLMFEQDSFGMPSYLSNIISAIIARQIKKLHSQAPYVPGRRTSEHTVSETHLNLCAVKKTTFAGALHRQLLHLHATNGHSSSCMGHSCPQVQEMEMSCYNLHIFSGNLTRLLSAMCFLPLCQRQEHYLKNIARQIDWKYLMARLWKELRWLNLKGTKGSAYLIFGFSQKKKGGGAGVWWDVLGGHPLRQSTRLRVADTFFGWPREGIHF